MPVLSLLCIRRPQPDAQPMYGIGALGQISTVFMCVLDRIHARIKRNVLYLIYHGHVKRDIVPTGLTTRNYVALHVHVIKGQQIR